MTNPSYHPRLHFFALLTAGCTFLLLLAGALVTSTGSSLAVPDWPLSFGTLFPEMKGGVLFEHGHRLIAGTVSTLMVLLAVAVQLTEERAWVKKLAWSALGAVLLQALLGGLTVLLKLPTEVSVAHAGLAQIFFCLIVSLTLVTSRYWIEEKPARLKDRPSPVRSWALGTVILLYLQILLGAVTRHSGSGLAILDFPLSFGHWLPPDWTGPVALQFSHTRIGAFLALLFTAHTAYRACYHYPEEKGIFYPAAAAGFLILLQCMLGLLILITQKAILPTSLHVIGGAATLASMLVLTLNCYHLFRKDPTQ
jgi:cytochrome c oxidase assembly protein subunit 15